MGLLPHREQVYIFNTFCAGKNDKKQKRFQSSFQTRFQRPKKNENKVSQLSLLECIYHIGIVTLHI